MKARYLVPALATALLAGCGMAGTSAVAVGQAEAAVEEAKEAEKIKAKVEQDVAAAQQAAAKQLEAVDAE